MINQHAVQVDSPSYLVPHHRDEDGRIVVECPALSGWLWQGRDQSDALTNTREAITAWLWPVSRKEAVR